MSPQRQMFIAALFIIAKIWKQSRCSTVSDGQIAGSIQTMEYGSTLKRNETSNREKTRRNLTRLFLSGRSHSGKATHCPIPTARHVENVKTKEMIKQSLLPGAEEWGHKQAEHRIFRAVKLTSMILMWQIHGSTHLSKCIECTPLRANPNAN